MTLNKDYSTAFIFFHEGSIITANRVELESKKTSQMQLHRYKDPVNKAIIIQDGLLLSNTFEDLLLVDIDTGFSSFVFEGTTHMPPCSTSDCGHDHIKVKALANMNDQKFILAFELDSKLMKLQYAVGKLPQNHKISLDPELYFIIILRIEDRKCLFKMVHGG